MNKWNIVDFYDGIVIAASGTGPRHAIAMIGIAGDGERIYARFPALAVSDESLETFERAIKDIQNSLEGAELVDLGFLVDEDFVLLRVVKAKALKGLFPSSPDEAMFRLIDVDMFGGDSQGQS